MVKRIKIQGQLALELDLVYFTRVQDFEETMSCYEESARYFLSGADPLPNPPAAPERCVHKPEVA
jgi:hypothetical protein